MAAQKRRRFSAARRALAKNDTASVSSPPRRPTVETLEARTLLAGDGLQGLYFGSADLTGPAQQHLDALINFNWSRDPLPQGLSPDLLSVRWTGELVAPASGVYRFATASQGGVRLWLNGKSVIADWRTHRLR